jgi:Tfp pilus assembly protein PilZ
MLIVKKRPIQLIIIALVQVLDPVVNIVLNSFYFHKGPMEVIRLAWENAPWTARFSFFLLGPTMALAIFSIKRWSMALAIGCTGFIVYENVSQWLSFPKQISGGIIIAICALQLVLLAYLWLPQVRVAYLDRRLRWWESQPRYIVRLECSINFRNQIFPAETVNLSEGGVFLVSARPLKSGDLVTLIPHWLDDSVMIPAKVVYEMTQDGSRGYGLQMMHTTHTLRSLRKSVEEIAKQGVASSVEPRDFLLETRVLIADLSKGKSWVPDTEAKKQRYPKTPTSKRPKRAA